MGDPYARGITLGYEGQGRLNSVIDAQGLVTSFGYGSQNLITSMVTPYGTTYFSSLADAGFDDDATKINRALLITEPNGPNPSKELYLYRNVVSQTLIPNSYGGALPNTGPGSTFENIQMYTRNSFHWGRQQYAALSIAAQPNPDLTSLNSLTSVSGSGSCKRQM